MNFSIIVAFVIFCVVGTSKGLSCSEEAVCLTFPKQSLSSYCASFLKVPCPVTCGKCSSEKLKLKFSSAFDANADSKITLEEAQSALKLLNVNMEDAIVTEIKDLIFDTKTALVDLFTKLDADKDSLVTINELFAGLLNIAESTGIILKPEMRQTLTYIADIIQVDKSTELTLPKIIDLVQLVTTKLQSYPHGLLPILRLQNMTQNKFDFERIITTQQLTYTINSKMFLWSLLSKLDTNDDDYLSVREVVSAILLNLEFFDVKLENKTHENIQVYLTMLENSVKVLLTKYGLTDISQLDGKVLTEFNNQKFVDERIRIKDIIANAKPFTSGTVSKYLKAASNGIPQKKLTLKSIIEAIFIAFDKNKDFELDLIEFSDLFLIGLPKIGAGLQDYNEALKVAKLFDSDHDDKLSMKELIEMLKLESMPRAS